MERYVIAARLRPGKAAEAEEALTQGPPFDPAAAGLSSHAAFLTADAVYLLFEGQAARTTALRLAREHLVDVSRWQAIVNGLPSTVEEVPPDSRSLYRWSAAGSAPS